MWIVRQFRTPWSPWARLILSIRLLAAATAVSLLLIHRVTDNDTALVIAVTAYALVTGLIVRVAPEVSTRPVAWALDTAIVLAMVVVSGDWRSPFFLLALSTLVTPAISLVPRQALGLGLGFGLVYFVIGHFIGPAVLTRSTQTTLETLATHLVLPMLVTFGTASTADALRRLRTERMRSERLAIEAERKRIAWELHDSAKARIHAAHLVLSAMRGAPEDALRSATDQVLTELQAAAADMDTSLAELESPLEGRPLDEALRERAAELVVRDGPVFAVRGSVGELEPLIGGPRLPDRRRGGHQRRPPRVRFAGGHHPLRGRGRRRDHRHRRRARAAEWQRAVDRVACHAQPGGDHRRQHRHPRSRRRPGHRRGPANTDRPTGSPPMIRIVVCDDHHALRAGLATVLEAEPGLVPVGFAGDEHELWPVLNTTRPDVVLLDYHLPGSDGLQLCRRLKAEALAPAVLLYSAYAGGDLAIPAILAGADGVIDKGIPARELFEAIRTVADGGRVLPPVAAELRVHAVSRLEHDDLPILGMLLEGTPSADIAEVLGISATELSQRIDGMIVRLRVEVPELRRL